MPLALRPFYPMGQRWPSLELTLQAQVVDPRPEAWLPSPDQGSRLWDGPRPRPRTHVPGQETELRVGPALQRPQALPIVPEEPPSGLPAPGQGHGQGHGLLAGLRGGEARALRSGRHGSLLLAGKDSRQGRPPPGTRVGRGAHSRGPRGARLSRGAALEDGDHRRSQAAP